MTRLHTSKLAYVLALSTFAPCVKAQDVVVHGGETKRIQVNDVLTYDTVIVEPGGVLRLDSTIRATLHVARGMRIEGTLDLSGEDARPQRHSGGGALQAQGGAGGPLGGWGGTGHPTIGASCAQGGSGLDTIGAVPQTGGGGGGDTAVGLVAGSSRYAGGGGGGRLAADQPVTAPPLALANLGLVATPGFPGAQQVQSALVPGSPPRGGTSGALVFVDNNPLNDFWGSRFDPVTQTTIVGELFLPIAGRGGGGGGDSITSSSFPQTPYNPYNEIKGSGGGGGGGLGVIVTPRLEIVGAGAIRANGGMGAPSADLTGNPRPGGAGGGGSGGMLVIQVTTLDMRSANQRAITALGGRGGQGMGNLHDTTAAGGNGGPGLVQLHMVNGPGGILLPPGKLISDMTAPTPYLLQPIVGL